MRAALTSSIVMCLISFALTLEGSHAESRLRGFSLGPDLGATSPDQELAPPGDDAAAAAVGATARPYRRLQPGEFTLQLAPVGSKGKCISAKSKKGDSELAMKKKLKMKSCRADRIKNSQRWHASTSGSAIETVLLTLGGDTFCMGVDDFKSKKKPVLMECGAAQAYTWQFPAVGETNKISVSGDDGSGTTVTLCLDKSLRLADCSTKGVNFARTDSAMSV